jgi:hypothetical protein
METSNHQAMMAQSMLDSPEALNNQNGNLQTTIANMKAQMSTQLALGQAYVHQVF